MLQVEQLRGSQRLRRITKPVPKFTIRPRYVLWSLLLIALCFALVSAVGQYVLHEAESSGVPLSPKVERVIQLTDSNLEANIPTWYTSILLLGCALLVGMIAISSSRFRRRWMVLALVFVALSVDEAAALHDGLSNFVRDTLNSSGMFYVAWVIPALIFVGIMALAYLPLLRALPAEIRLLFIVSGAMYVGGAAGLEMLSSYLGDVEGNEPLLSAAVRVVEEFLEMGGIAVFIYALLRYIRDYSRSVRVTLVPFHPAAAVRST